ncbi:MIF4G domain-containing protein isoform X1 [Indicator indicator]|uniref:MIF4G domain-containing protein isoform X1 n=1 Tax=Indicator indicator TaxID=1002788 RepID=UPI0023DF3435|nr:MIF4G domain-containing protein isoform X1 [Indicator indicator]
MGETGKEEYKIQSFDTETQKLLKTALKDPSNVDLEKVANIIVDQSLKDCVFSKEAGRICYTIIQAESKQAGQSIFRRSLLNRLQQEYKDREELRSRSLQAWICYVTFICNIFDYLRVNNMPMMALVNPVYDCLFRLAQPDSLRKEEEVSAGQRGLTAGDLQRDAPKLPVVYSSPLPFLLKVDCLVLQLHRIGEQLEKMNSQRMDELFSLLRDGFLLQEGLSSLSQLLLLEIIEFRAADWKMTDAAQKYYYSEVTD